MAILCQLKDPRGYDPFDWSTVQNDEDRDYWLDLFDSFPGKIRKRLEEDGLKGADFDARWPVFCREYAEGIALRRTDPARRQRQSTIELGEFRQSLLDRHGWPDPYVAIKARENSLAAGLYPSVVSEIDAAIGPERWELLFRGLFAGNMFDLGCPDTIEMYENGQIDFHSILAKIPDRPWFIDDADDVRERMESPHPWRQALFFVDNAGTDIVLGAVPLVREMARAGTRVVMAANSAPVLNDITIDELNLLLQQLTDLDPVLADLLESRRITTVANGSNSPLIDLSRISDACNAAARDSDLIVLEGMGRGVESNWRQEFRCDMLRIALLKDRIVTKWVGANLFDPVCRFEAKDAQPQNAFR